MIEVALTLGVVLLVALTVVAVSCYQWGWRTRDSQWWRVVADKQQEAQDALVAPLPRNPIDEL